MIRSLVCVSVVLSLAMLCIGALAQPAPEVTLTFDAPMTAIINARQWDQTQQVWGRKAGEYYFDAVHRFLLTRFPGCAAAVQAKRIDGYEIAGVKLSLTWKDQEFQRVAGYSWRNYPYKDKPEPSWHARGWLLRRAWIDDPQRRPTWNAFANGIGYWRQGGAHDPNHDRLPNALEQVELSNARPVGVFDLTPLFTADRTERMLQQLDYCGVLLQKAEMHNREYGESGLATSVARIFTTAPLLTVTLRKGKAVRAALPAVDIDAYLIKLKQAGGDGQPTTVIPEKLAELAKAHREQRQAAVPAWAWPHVQDLWQLPPHYGIDHGYDWFTQTCRALESGDKAQYEKAVNAILSVPPGWFAGHQHIEYLLPLIIYGDLLPDVVRYHLRRGFEARWEMPLDPKNVFSHQKVTGVGTFNHMAQARPKALLGAELTGKTELAGMAEYGLWLLSRHMVFCDGYSQELGDSYYRGITLAPLQAAAKYSRDPLMRLNASLMVEKLLLEDISTYHPGLRKRVSRISRRMGEWPQSLIDQDVAEGALHTLSQAGALLELDAPGEPKMAHGLKPFNFHATPAVRVALMAPWGPEWLSNAIDRKPLPFRTVHTTYVMDRIKEPIYAMTYMGRNYALASEQAYTSATVPVQAAWRRAAKPASKLDDIGVLTIQGRLNEQPPTSLEQTPFGVLQQNNTLIYLLHAPEVKLLQAGDTNFPPVAKDGLRSFKCAVNLYTFGPDGEREVWVNEQRVTQFPITARFGDIITIKEGVCYLGLRPLPATNLGRKDEIVIRQEHPLLQISAYLYQSDTPLAGLDRLTDATAGWVLEMADAEDHASFAAFRAQVAAAKLQTRWEAPARTLHITYANGKDTLETGFRTDFEREMLWHKQLPPSKVFAYQRVNGAWPWPDRSIDLDNPLAQMGKAARLEKGGAVLEKAEGRMGLLRVEPISGTYEGVNPFVEPAPFTLHTPEGAVVRADGLLGMARVTVRPKEQTLWVDYHLPPDSLPNLVKLQQEQGRFFYPGVNLKTLRRDSARALLVSGFTNPVLILNGKRVPGPFPQQRIEGKIWYRIPIAEE
ncbi:MAG: hypothetical protein ACYDBB_12830 [Armatimonadota bacterium]